MRKTRFFFILVLIFVFVRGGYGQTEDEDEKYDTEITGGINFNTNANILGGVMGALTKRINKHHFHYFGLEIVNVKHPKEVRVPSSSTGNLYIFQKTNHLIPIRLQYGREIVLFHPAEEEGVQVSFVAAAGPTIGILKPYMVEVDYGGYSQIEAFDPEKRQVVIGSAGIFSGFGLAKIVPAFNIKTSFNFKFSQFFGSVTGIEVGAMIEAYPKEMKLIAVSSAFPQPTNQKTFTSIFINVFFGSRN